MNIDEIEKEFDKKYCKGVFKAYPDFTESHKILLQDIKSFYRQQLIDFGAENFRKGYDAGIIAALRQNDITLIEAIEKSIEGGYKGNRNTNYFQAQFAKLNWQNCAHYPEVLPSILIDPDFFKALGKTMGWKGKFCYICGGGEEVCICISKDAIKEEWLVAWHSFIDHLAGGGTIEGFFKQLN